MHRGRGVRSREVREGGGRLAQVRRSKYTSLKRKGVRFGQGRQVCICEGEGGSVRREERR